ncbi:DUF397 domain-containing protein [Streptomyces sp. 8K308]|uniref:DUF397 domain-containing protein n=1 Tax=Streptomyces sp. 8K308 TaxID=2530388 RepID=UPI0010441761|nr:DUF397 domain-containing protein [Streptomyces sp. 8K308]TDC23410.1 DUF397 domain-containing protein [Streptomyces sp. 8K308]
MTHTRPLTGKQLAGIATWRKSSYSDGTGQNCIEVADLTSTAYHGFAVRDSKNPTGPALLLASERFTAFVRALQEGSDIGQLP